MTTHDTTGEVVVHAPEHSRYEIHLDGRRVGLADYVERERVIVITHTEVLPDLNGRGLGGRLTEGMLRDLRRRGLKVIPRCPFTAAWIDGNPGYADLLAW